MVLSDACFSGALFRGAGVELAARENVWYRRAIAQPSRWGISSGNLETVPDDSTFARKLITALHYPERSVFSASGRQRVRRPVDDDGAHGGRWSRHEAGAAAFGENVLGVGPSLLTGAYGEAFGRVSS